MKNEYFTTKWLRRLEIFSLLVTIIATPLVFFIFAIMTFYAPGLKSANHIGAVIEVIIGLMFILTFDIFFAPILKHYIYHKETRDDVIRARVSYIFIFGNIMLYIVLFIAILRFS